VTVRSSWKGSLTFGVVSCPIRLYNAAEERSVRFRTLHRKCGRPISMPRFCPFCEERAEDTVRGYEVAKDRFVPIEEAEMEALPLPTARTVEVVEFVEPGALDIRAYGRPYFVAPEEAGRKAFALLLRAMEETGLVAIGRIAMRDRERLVAVRPYRGVLLLQVLHWADELKPVEEFQVELPGVSERELALARTLVEAMRGEGDLSAYRDRYREALLELVQAKMEGRAVEAPAGDGKKPSDDLAQVLLASIQAAKAREGMKDGQG
jgi:DNA end-binding protein Ku